VNPHAYPNGKGEIDLNRYKAQQLEKILPVHFSLLRRIACFSVIAKSAATNERLGDLP